MSRSFILYKLSLLTLPLLFFCSLIYEDLRFVLCSKVVKKYFSKSIKRLGAKQITELNYFKTGVVLEGHKFAIEAAKLKLERNKTLGDSFSKYGESDRYAALIEIAFMRGWVNHLLIVPLLVQFLETHKSKFSRIDFFSSYPPSTLHFPASFCDKVNIISFHHMVLNPLGILTRSGVLVMLAIFPVLNLLLLIKKGIKFKMDETKPPVSKKKILFVHRERSFFSRNLARNSYFFNSKILEVEDCVHFLMITSESFAADKKNFILKNKGELLEVKDLTISIRRVFSHSFAIYYARILFSNLGIIFKKDVNFYVLRQILEILHLMHVAEALVKSFSPNLIHFETETAPFCNIVAIEAQKRNLATSTMLHGAAAQDKPSYNRSNMQFDYVFSPGKDNKIIRLISPNIKEVIAVGNHEVDLSIQAGLNPSLVLPKWLIENRAMYKVVGFFLVLEQHFTPVKSFASQTHYFDEDLCKAHTQKLLKPFFDWILENENLILLWKPKDPAIGPDPRLSFEHPWVAPFVKKIPKKRFIPIFEMPVTEIINVSDVVIATGGSSIISCAMAMKKPVISFELSYGGWCRKYHENMVAMDGVELARKLRILIEEGLPDEVFEAFNRDWYADGTVDYKTAERIRKIIKKWCVG